MNVEKLEQLLKNKRLYKKTKNKNIIAICPFCGDHKDDRKKGHLYISIDENKPIYHCFINDCSGNIRQLVKFLIGDNSKQIDEIITKDEILNIFKNRQKIDNSKIRPKIYVDEQNKKISQEKYDYLNKRCFYKFENIKKLLKDDILIFDINHFFEINKYNENIQYFKDSYRDFLSNIYDNCIGFLSKHKSILVLRSINDKVYFKYYKLKLYDFNENLLDYFCIDISDNLMKKENYIVLTEGIFDLFGYLSYDVLKLIDKVKIFAAGFSFSYQSLLKSIVYDYALYKNKVIILSDSDKQVYKYNKFYYNSKHVIENLKIYYNKDKKDFGCFPNKAVLMCNK